ncbi:MAG: Glu-tRNA(Gln) amidotransferase subunit GatE [Candidatus Thermoplasmatota archaeon]|nr:Glu-tRNA(Gln) amidotransferase subunit GatE [Candidatus Thermoplasmatota archaeon]MCL5731736.1 Glu-tRNA(Gln) amidotransferase subunit GatE [Candidatus Thermoplasmatota archaeon]
MNSEEKIRIGLEVHAQLATGKLFCRCSSGNGTDTDFRIKRRLWTVSGEMGEIDRAASYERERNRSFLYRKSVNSCLVEADEDPPHEINQNALMAAIRVSLAMDSVTFRNMCVMRKLVVDGSNTSGFQRTMLVSLGGYIDTGKGKVNISSLCLEEDSARKVSAEGEKAEYSLSRLGIPLLEISTEPDIQDENQAVEVARKIGDLVAGTGFFRPSAEAIRQDVNLSLGYGRVEIKGVSKLSLISEAIRYEVSRQRNLKRLSEELNYRLKGEEVAVKFRDVTDKMSESGSKIAKSQIENGSRAFCTILKKCSGLLKSGEYRLGMEIAEMVKMFGLKGVMHSDELPAYGVSEDILMALRSEMRAGTDDAILIIFMKENMSGIIEREIEKRIRKVLMMDLSETRYVTEDGHTHFLRPLPGSERMYPETDIPYVSADELISRASALGKIEDAETRAVKISEKFGISRQDATTIVKNFMEDEFVRIAEILSDGRLSARLLVQFIPEMERKKKTMPDRDLILELLKFAGSRGYGRESIEVMIEMLSSGFTVEQIKNSDEIKPLTIEEINKMIHEAGKINKPGELIAYIKSRTRRPLDPVIIKKVMDNIINEQ